MLLEYQLPEAVEVAVFVDGSGFLHAEADFRFWLICKVDADTAALSLDIDESDMMLRSHWVGDTSDLHFDDSFALSFAITFYEVCDEWNMLLEACIYGVRSQLLHLLSAANYRYLRIHHFLDHIAAMRAFIKFC